MLNDKEIESLCQKSERISSKTPDEEVRKVYKEILKIMRSDEYSKEQKDYVKNMGGGSHYVLFMIACSSYNFALHSDVI